MAPFPGLTSQCHVGRLTTLDHIPRWKGQQCFFSLTAVATYSGYEFALPAVMLLPSVNLQNALFALGGILHPQQCSNQGAHFTVREVWQWAHNHGIITPAKAT